MCARPHMVVTEGKSRSSQGANACKPSLGSAAAVDSAPAPELDAVAAHLRERLIGDGVEAAVRADELEASDRRGDGALFDARPQKPRPLPGTEAVS